MFQRDQMLTFFQQVDELEAQLDAGEFGRLEMGYGEDELIQMAEAIMEEISEG